MQNKEITETILINLAMLRNVVGIQVGTSTIRVWFYDNGLGLLNFKSIVGIPDIISILNNPKHEGLNYFDILPENYLFEFDGQTMGHFKTLEEYAYLTNTNPSKLFGLEGYDVSMGYLTSLPLTVLKQLVEHGLTNYLGGQMERTIHNRIEMLEAYKERNKSKADLLNNPLLK